MAVSVAVEGGTARGPADTPGRIRLLRRIVDRLCAADRPGNAAFVVLPGGFFRLGEFLGHLPASERRARIAGAGFTPACREAASRLAEIVPGAVVVAGVDTVAGHGEWADQLAVAWDSAGVAGVGRKVFPTATGPLGVEPECRGMVIDAADFDDPGRVVDLPGGRRGVLCACYDGFGVFDPRRRAWPIERLRVGGRIVRWDEPGFDTAWERAVRGWIALVKGVDTALIAIHGFGGGGNSSYWQRHGIATASAALGGGFAVAGAHFSPLPRWEGVQTLCAGGVDRGHLGLGNHRRKESLAPAGNAWLDGALLRWFAVR